MILFLSSILSSILSFVEAKRAEQEGQRLAQQILSQEQIEFKKQEENNKKRKILEENDQNDAERIQMEEIEKFREQEKR